MAPPPDREDKVYDTNRLSKWFAISSIFFLLAVIWALIEDFDRDWKRYMRQSKRITAAVGESTLKAANKAIPAEELAKLEKEIAQLKASQEQTQLETEIAAKIAKVKAVLYRSNQNYQFRKAALDAMKFELDTALEHKTEHALEVQKKYRALEKEVEDLRLIAYRDEKDVEAALATQREIVADKKKTQDRIEELTRRRDLASKTISQNELSFVNTLRNLPMLDIIAPTIKVAQIELPELLDDYAFNKVPRVDRCISCHTFIDKKGFEDLPQPFKTHPKLDMYLSAKSKHPVEKFGCTVCHSGVPQSMDFSLAGHRPQNPVQEADWEKKYGFYRNHHLPTPMVPLGMTEGKCIQCHASEIRLEGAPTFNAGMQIIERAGCFNCHKFEGQFDEFAKQRKNGPSLLAITSKVTPEWMRKWIWDPKGFRPTTLMPQFWRLHNNSDPKSIERGQVEADAIVHYLEKKAVPYQPLPKPANLTGNVDKGKQLVGSVGCLGCHAVKDFPRPDIKDPTQLGWRDPRVPMFGPELNQMGSKVNEAWLYSWLTNPKHYWADTRMPSMRLSPQEAADVSAYLLSMKNPEFDGSPSLRPQDKVRDEVIMSYFVKQMSAAEAQTKLASMSLDDRKMWLGQKMVGAYGCYSCHAIAGFENGPRIGAELSYEGSKDPTKLAFGHVKLDHKARAEWIYTKIRTPRVFDVGFELDFEGKTRMPQFGFTHEQALAAAAIVVGNENRNVLKEAQRPVDARLASVIQGHKQIRLDNCVGCHAIEGRGAEILAFYQEDNSSGPPNLNTQGLKTRPDFLFGFLKQPYTIRPWLSVRMPTFGMGDVHATNYTKFFAAVDNNLGNFPFYTQDYSLLSSSDRNEVERLIKQQGCMTCHAIRKPGEEVATAAPHFNNVRVRLNGSWTKSWIADPNSIMPGTRMPQLWGYIDPEDPSKGHVAVPGYFGDDADKQMSKVRDYLFQYGQSLTIPETTPVPRVPTYTKDSEGIHTQAR